MSYQDPPSPASSDNRGQPGIVPTILVRAATFDQASEPLPQLHPQLSASMPIGTQSHNSGDKLELQLWDVSVTHAQPGMKSFWPPLLWKSLVTRESVRAELLEPDHEIDPKTVSNLERKIFDSSSGTRLLVFTILLLGSPDFAKSLGHMLTHCKHGGIRDQDLPLVLGGTKRESALLHHHGGEVADCCFRGWKHVNLESFVDFQRRLSPPVFGLKESDNTLIHLDLDDQAILPWCDVKENLIPVAAMSGGYGTVWRVRIHPKCHKFGRTLEAINVAGGLFAVKRLKQKDGRVEFEQEVTALKRFNGKVHKHMVTLLATFTQGGYYHMIFPWAECDLDTYWESHAHPNLEDHGLIRWVSKQCLGIMEAISLVHNPQHLTSATKYGRHGDIKAENILWYKTNDSNHRGILVISDFGLAAINSAKSRSMMPNDYVGLKMTPSYRPPECDTLGGVITRAFDIWTLGCLYLELVCWLLRGTTGKKNFDTARTTPFILGSRVDIFFDIQSSRQDSSKYIFLVKEVVSRTMSELHDEPKCTQWIHDLLDVIEQDMLLVLSPEHKRKNAKDLLARLREMDEIARSSKSYCVDGKPKKRLTCWKKPSGVLSELNDAARRHVKEMKPSIDTYNSEGRSLHRSLRPSEWAAMEK